MPRRKPLPVMVNRSQPPGWVCQTASDNPAHRVAVAAAAGPEGGKIVLARERQGGRGQGLQIKLRGQPPAVMMVQGRTVGPVQDAVLVGLGEGALAGVKLRGDLLGPSRTAMS